MEIVDVCVQNAEKNAASLCGIKLKIFWSEKEVGGGAAERFGKEQYKDRQMAGRSVETPD